AWSTDILEVFQVPFRLMNNLRHLAVFVKEPEPGTFYWTLIESTGDAGLWFDVHTASQPFAHWIDAWMAGNDELLRHVSRPSEGPLLHETPRHGLST
ncbi:hypothetical protein QN397_26235, partial [Variovorax sp. RTB1]|uniref:hypothetical protein n=1 Tax=Variovorax sp. RTB1 TaxID=3048631 RepID=UPI002B239D0D